MAVTDGHQNGVELPQVVIEGGALEDRCFVFANNTTYMWDIDRWLNNHEAVEILLKKLQDFNRVSRIMQEAHEKSQEAFDKRLEEQREEKRLEEKRLEK